MNITVRPATASDLPLLVEGNERLASETEDKQLNGETLAAGINALLLDKNKGRYFVAEIGNRPAGQLMTTYEWSDWRDGYFWWIQSVYVWSEFRRQGVFRALYEHLAKSARESTGVIGLRLYVENENTPAQEVYKRMGMLKPGYFVLEQVFD